MGIVTPEDPRPAELAAAGLYDPAASDAEERLALLLHLLERGVTMAEMLDVTEDARLVTLAANRSLFDLGNALTVQQIADAYGVSVDRVLRLRLAAGFAADPESLVPGWTAEDLAGFDLGAQFFGEAPILAFTRVVGASAGKVAEAALALFLAEVETRLDSDGATLVEHALANERASELVDVVTTLMTHFLREHLTRAVLNQRANTTPSAPDRSVFRLAVGFVDLASSTEWANAISLREQVDALARFESAAWDIATGRGGRVVKLIGDEAMFTCFDVQSACEIALDLCEAVEKEPALPRARGAVGLGEVVVRDGDYYGPLVHTVARAVKAAEEGTIVVTEPVRDAVAGRGIGPDGAVSDSSEGVPFRFELRGEEQLRGIEHPVTLYTVHRSNP